MPQKEMYKLDDIVRFMIQYPDVHISVTGYADVQTAYPAYNLKLGEERANEVIRVLTILYGMDADRISGKSLGDTVQPFRVNDSNRVVIAIDVEE
jgi:outer membrane protein OmpA-like peptidoglycan-associated protein